MRQKGLMARTVRGQAAVAIVLVGGAAGCASRPCPSHVANFWVPLEEDIVVRVHGESPTIEIENRGPGALQRVDWLGPTHEARLGGIGPGGTGMFTLADGAGVRLADSMGCEVIVRVWNATAYELVNESDTTAQAAHEQAADGRADR